MASISNVDLVMAALRARLERISRDKRARRSEAPGRAPPGAPASAAPDLKAYRRLPPREFNRALVRVLLEQDFGAGLAEDPRFQVLVERTAAVLEGDEECRALLRSVQESP